MFPDELAVTKGLLNTNMYYLKMSNTINNEMNKKHLIEQQNDTNMTDEKVLYHVIYFNITSLFFTKRVLFLPLCLQATILVELKENLKYLHAEIKDLQKEKNDLQMKLVEFEKQAAIDTQTVQALEKSMNIAKDELKTFYECQQSDIATHNLEVQLSTDSVNREMDILKNKLNEKQKQLELCEMGKMQMNVNHNTEISILAQELQSEKLKFIEKRYCLLSFKYRYIA